MCRPSTPPTRKLLQYSYVLGAKYKNNLSLFFIILFAVSTYSNKTWRKIVTQGLEPKLTAYKAAVLTIELCHHIILPPGLEPETYWLKASYSSQLSYRSVMLDTHHLSTESFKLLSVSKFKHSVRIELTFQAYKTSVLPLNYECIII